MKTEAATPALDLSAIEGIQLDGKLSPTQARALLELHFSEQDMIRMRALSAKARAGTLTADENAQIDTYERLGCLLDIVHSKARRVLERRKLVS